VKVTRVGQGVLLEPLAASIEDWFSELDRYSDVPFMEDGREQPPMPPDEKLFD
jgi:antitoxin VapB